MKKIFSSLLLAVLFSQSAIAQVFTIGKDGEALENNAVITVTEVEDDGFGAVMSSNLFVKNKLMTPTYIKVEYEIESISNGMMQICFPVNCHTHPEAGKFIADDNGKAVALAANAARDLQTEWLPDGEGTCRVRYTIKIFSATGTPLRTGNTVTVNYVYGTNAVHSPEANVVVVKYFDLTGREISSPKRGACIRQQIMSDGKVITRKFAK